MSDPFRAEPTGKSWADMVEEDEEDSETDDTLDNEPKDDETTSDPVTIETNDKALNTSDTDLAVDSKGGTDTVKSTDSTTTVANSTPVSRWAALDADRTYPRSSFNQRRNDFYRPTGGRFDHYNDYEDRYGNRNGGFSNRSNFNRDHRHRDYYYGLNKEDETPEAKKAIAAWNNYKPPDDEDEDTGIKQPVSTAPYNVVLITSTRPVLQKETHYDEKAARAATHDTQFSFSWADDHSDTSDNEEEDLLLRLSGKKPVGQQSDTLPVQEEKLNSSSPQSTSDSDQPVDGQGMKTDLPENVTPDNAEKEEVSTVKETYSAAKEEDHIKEESASVVDTKPTVEEPKPSFRWGALEEELAPTEEKTVTIEQEKLAPAKEKSTFTEEKSTPIEEETAPAEEEIKVVYKWGSLEEESVPIEKESTPLKEEAQVIKEEAKTVEQESEAVEDKTKPIYKWGALEEEPTPVKESIEPKTEKPAYVEKEPKPEMEDKQLVEDQAISVEEEPQPVYKWGVLDEYKEFEAKHAESQPAINMSPEKEAEIVAAWHDLKVPVDEEEPEQDQQPKEERLDDWKNQADWTQNEASSTPYKQQPDTPEQSPSKPETSWNTTDWNQPSLPKTDTDEAWGEASWKSESIQQDDVQEEKKSHSFKDSWRNKIQPVAEDKSSSWKSFAEVNSEPVPAQKEDKAPSYSSTIRQLEISQPHPKPSIPHEVAFSLSDFQGEPLSQPKALVAEEQKAAAAVPVISLSWGDFAQQAQDPPASISISTDDAPHQATVALHNSSEPVTVRLADPSEEDKVQQIQLKLEDVILKEEVSAPKVEQVQLKLADFASNQPAPQEEHRPKEERNPDAWGSVSDDVVIKSERNPMPTGTSQPRRKLQMGGAQWAHLQKSILGNKER